MAANVEVRKSPDFSEGVRAFLGKRKPEVGGIMRYLPWKAGGRLLRKAAMPSRTSAEAPTCAHFIAFFVELLVERGVLGGVKGALGGGVGESGALR